MTGARKLKVAVVLGGPSTEHDVSVASGRQVIAALDRERFEVVPVHVTRTGAWRVGTAPEAVNLETDAGGRRPGDGEGASPAAASPATLALAGTEALAGADRRVDVAFLALHGAFGEDGCVQGLMHLLGIPYTGSGVLASALAMDKVKAKEIYRLHGIPTARQFVVHRRAWRDADGAAREALASACVAEAGLPCVVKPVVGGSSFGTSLVEAAPEGASHGQLAAAIEEALDLDSRALVEERIVGTEVTCAVLGGGPHEVSQALPVTEIVPRGGAFFDFHAKYTKGACDEITPARISKELTARVQELAVRAHDALGCEGMSRTDFIVRDGVPTALETNTIPGMTPTSLLPQAAAAAGLPFHRLVERLIESALLRARA